MAYSIDLSLFDRNAHNPSFGALNRSVLEKKQKPKTIIDYCIPVNPYFPTQKMLDGYQKNFSDLLKYYPEQNAPIGEVLAQHLGLDPQNLVLSNGSTESITWIDHLLVKDSILTPIPTFGRWTDQPMETGKRLEVFERKEEEDFNLDINAFVKYANTKKVKAAAICNPNNPTGAILSKNEVLDLVSKLSHLDVVVVDESFIDFSSVDNIPSVVDEAHRFHNLIVVKSLGKNFGMHGIRFGFSVGNPRLINLLRKNMPHWNINSFAEAVIRDLPENKVAYELSRAQVILDRDYLVKELKALKGIKVFPSNANFAYIKTLDGVCGKQLRDSLISEYGYFVRECGNKVGASSNFIRIAANPKEISDKIVFALSETLNHLARG